MNNGSMNRSSVDKANAVNLVLVEPFSSLTASFVAFPSFAEIFTWFMFCLRV